MDYPVEIVYQAPSGFEEDNRDPLIDLDLSDSKELWLIQWPINQPSDFDGKQVSLKLDGDGHLGSFEGSSGKSYDMFSLKSQGSEAIVFLSSASGGKIAGKISRSVSLVHYPEPSEYQKRNNLNLSHSQRSSAATSTMSGRRTVSNHSSRGKNSQAVSGDPSKVSVWTWGSFQVSEEKTRARAKWIHQSFSPVFRKRKQCRYLYRIFGTFG